jgi:hypothetical protein
MLYRQLYGVKSINKNKKRNEKERDYNISPCNNGIGIKACTEIYDSIQQVRAFPAHFASILYFTAPKSHFSILTTHFYKIPHIPFSILQSFFLNILSLFLFVYYFITFTLTVFVSPDTCNGNNMQR